MGPRLGVGVATGLVLWLSGCNVGLPGQPGYRGTITVLNRTTAVVTVSSGEGGQIEIVVPACGEMTHEDFPINWWQVTSPGRDTFHSGGGDSGSDTYLIVTSVVDQQDVRPDPLPACEGLLQPAQQ
jgi:hypothetical protein